MIPIFTASWAATVPADHVRIGISRGLPRRQHGYKTYRWLAPGPWFRSVPADEYLRRFEEEILAPLDPEAVVSDLEHMTGGRPAVLLCFERASDIDAGRLWCHRHLVAEWLENTLSIEVPEYGWPRFDRWGALRRLGAR